MKKLFYVLSMLIMFSLLAAPIFNMNVNATQKIRVGLESQFKSVDSVTINNKKIYIGYDNKFWDYGFGSNNNFVMSVDKNFYIDPQKTFAMYQDALVQKNNYIKNGHKAVVCYDGRWMIYIGGYESLEHAQKDNLIFNGKIIAPDEKKILFSADENPLITFAKTPLQFKSDEFVKLSKQKYRGIIELGFYDAQKLTAVNVLDMNEYLYGVVPSEMPASWSKEALKAQCVAARSYVMTKLNSHKYYDVCDGVHCQMYLGVNNESEKVNKLVDETKDICIYYKGKPVNALFFSSSGGVTEDAQNVWSNSVEYLKSRIDTYEKTPKIWTREFTSEQIKQLLAANKIDIGDVLGIEVVDYLPSGRANQICIIGTEGTKMLDKENIRNFFAKSKGGILESRMFTIENKIESGEIDSGNFNCKIIFSGRGYGHGVGMSQYGAKGMAEAGFKFDDILKFYYAGVEVK